MIQELVQRYKIATDDAEKLQIRQEIADLQAQTAKEEAEAEQAQSEADKKRLEAQKAIIEAQKKQYEIQLSDAQYAYQVGTLSAEEYKVKLLDLAKAFKGIGYETQTVRLRRMADEMKKYGTLTEQAGEQTRKLKQETNLATLSLDAVKQTSDGWASDVMKLATGDSEYRHGLPDDETNRHPGP